MAYTKTSDLPDAAGLTGTELVETVQSGASVKTRWSAVLSYITTALGTTFLSRANNLSDLASAPTARTNLGLGSIATQGSGAVAITGGSVTGITDLTVADGGTGASSAPAARSNLGAAASGSNSDITSLSGLTTPLSIAQGGTSGTTAAAARTALGVVAGTVLASGTASSVTGTTTETTLATITIPAGAMGPNGQVEIIPLFSFTSSANNKTVKATFGGTTYYSQVYTMNTGIQPIIRIANRNSASSQVGAPSASANGLNGFTTSAATSTVNTASSVAVTITGTLANTGETITLESYLVRVTYAP